MDGVTRFFTYRHDAGFITFAGDADFTGGEVEVSKFYADEFGQPFNSMRGAYYAHTRSLGGSPKRSSKRETAVDPIEAATIVLNNAIDAIDTEVDAAKARADEAKAEYEHLKGSAAERKTALKAKVDALSA